MKSIRGYFFVLGAITFWGISATIARSLFARSVDPLVLVQMRMTLSCIILCLILAIVKRDRFKVKPRDLYRFALLGIAGMAGSNFFYYFAIQQTNVATAILLQYLAPLFVLLYAAISREETVGPVKAIAGAVSLAGCFVAVTGTDLSILTINRPGLLAGLGAACSWGFTNVWLRRLLRSYDNWTCLLYAFISGSLFWLLINPPWAIVASKYSASTWSLFLGFAVISVLIPHSLYFLGLRYLTASRAIITATAEPIIAITSAYLLLGETLSWIQALGAVLVLSAIAVLQLSRERQADPNGAAVAAGEK